MFILNDIRVYQFAKEINQILIKLKKKRQDKNIPLSMLNILFENKSALKEKFAKGVLAIRTSNECRGVKLKIVNGTKYILEKLFQKHIPLENDIDSKIIRS